MTLDEARAHIGYHVFYVPIRSAEATMRGEHVDVEQGVITSVNDEYVFVKYHPEGCTSAATRPEDLVPGLAWRKEAP